MLNVQRTVNKCPRCAKGPIVVDLGTGESLCNNCGYVLKERLIDSGPEWRSFSSEDKTDPSRSGSPTSITKHDMGLSTQVGEGNRDASGRVLSPTMKSTMNRLRIWDNRSQVHESSDRNLRQAFSELDRLADKLSVSEAVVEKAAYTYRKALEKELVKEGLYLP